MILKTHTRKERTILTTGGELQYKRDKRAVLRPASKMDAARLRDLGYSKTIAPLDYALHINDLPFKMTVEMMLEVARQGVISTSYDRAEEELHRRYGVNISDDTIRQVTDYVGKKVHEEDCRIVAERIAAFENWVPPAPRDLRPDILYLEADGAALNTRVEEENGSSWKENKLGMAFSSDHIHEWRDKNKELHRAILERGYTAYLGSADVFGQHLLALAIAHGYGLYKETVLISDGAPWIRDMRRTLFPDAHQILDFFHLCENVHTYSKAIFKRDEDRARTWAKDICDRLNAGKHADVLKELKKYKRRKLPKDCVKLPQYIADNIDSIDYPTYRSRGWIVGSGAIESSNKTVMQSRMKLAGMRWNVASAQHMLSLKCKLESKQWNQAVVPLIRHLLE